MIESITGFKMKISNHDKLVAKALRTLAKIYTDEPKQVSREQGRELDRALRCCKGISDIDIVWVRWGHIGDELDWNTDKEMKFNKKGYFYYPEDETK